MLLFTMLCVCIGTHQMVGLSYAAYFHAKRVLAAACPAQFAQQVVAIIALLWWCDVIRLLV